MCLFPSPNLNPTSLSYRKGITEFDCGACPECLRKRSNAWALRAVYESCEHLNNCMVTLTYDSYKLDSEGRPTREEQDPNPDLHVNVRDVQLFIKRLRKWYSSFSSDKIKYIACAEYGSRTHRAHYHVIFFGVKFPDLVYYKRSKRGNPIYKSHILTKLWSHGICTVDSITVRSAVARYCTKYCAKSRSDDTFMLSSQGIGLDGLMRDFNGKSYYIDGREYTIPRVVWQRYISDKYKDIPGIDYRYVNRAPDGDLPDIFISYNLDGELVERPCDRSYEKGVLARKLYRAVRDSDPVYCNYLEYWKRKGEAYSQNKASVFTRICLLPDYKYHFYKVAALRCLSERNELHNFSPAPGSNCVSAFFHSFYDREKRLGICHLPVSPCLNRASDTKLDKYDILMFSKYNLFRDFSKNPFTN